MTPPKPQTACHEKHPTASSHSETAAQQQEAAAKIQKKRKSQIKTPLDPKSDSGLNCNAPVLVIVIVSCF